MSIYLFNHKNRGEIMALSKNTSEENQINFDDLIVEAEYKEDEKEIFYTITGKEQEYNHEWEIYKNYEADVGDYLEGKPEVRIIEKSDKTYNALCIRVIDNTTNEVLDCYCNFPKRDLPYVTGLNKDFDFYRTAFDFIFSVLKTRGEKYVLDKNGEEYNNFKRVDFIGFAKLVDTMSKIRIEITEGNEDSEYNSWMITHME